MASRPAEPPVCCPTDRPTRPPRFHSTLAEKARGERSCEGGSDCSRMDGRTHPRRVPCRMRGLLGPAGMGPVDRVYCSLSGASAEAAASSMYMFSEQRLLSRSGWEMGGICDTRAAGTALCSSEMKACARLAGSPEMCARATRAACACASGFASAKVKAVGDRDSLWNTFQPQRGPGKGHFRRTRRESFCSCSCSSGQPPPPPPSPTRSFRAAPQFISQASSAALTSTVASSCSPLHDSGVSTRPDPARWTHTPVSTVPQYLGRKTLPIKRADGEPLTRADIQYDLLYFIFADPNRVFVDYMAPGKPLVNFCDLYVNALFNSSKCSKVLKDKMVDTPEFAIEFAKIALLTNVGRINTTMAFFHEMKTPLRSYHPVPSLQKSDGNLQDAPRIKNCLKAALLPFEFKSPPPTSPNEIREKARAGQLPPTSVVNLIFVLSNAQHAMQIAQTHFEPPVEFLDLFLPLNLSSASRARAFLWLVYHYLSAPDSPNPFDDDYSRAHPGKVPRLEGITREEMARENVDPDDEVEWGKHMSALRVRFLKELMEESEAEKRRKRDAQMVPPVSSSFSAAMYSGDITSGRLTQTQGAGSSGGEGSRGSSYGHDVPGNAQGIQQPAPRPAAAAGPSQPGRSGQDDQSQDRTMLQHAWHVVQTTDPLADSDGEQDEHVRREYGKRLRILSRLRGKDPTPPPGGPAPGMPQYQSQFQGANQAGPSQEATGRLRQVTWE